MTISTNYLYSFSKMKAYIINLPKDTKRHEHINQLLASYQWMEKEFVEAVYGKELSENEVCERFDIDLAYKRYGRELNRGEIGCTLSHKSCYEKLVKSNESWAIVFEDDITILHDISPIASIVEQMNDAIPTILFLSGDYWFLSTHRRLDSYKIVSVYDAVGTYAYVVNKKAAELILAKNPKPSFVSDNWLLFRRQGVKLFAINPYLIDANIENFKSSIEQDYFGEKRKNMPLLMALNSYWSSLVKRTLVKTGHFVSKIRK